MTKLPERLLELLQTAHPEDETPEIAFEIYRLECDLPEDEWKLHLDDFLATFYQYG